MVPALIPFFFSRRMASSALYHSLSSSARYWSPSSQTAKIKKKRAGGGGTHLLKKVQLFSALLEHSAEHVLQCELRNGHVAGQAASNHFPLRHEELRQVKRALGRFCAKGSGHAISIALGAQHRRLEVKLRAHAQIHAFAKEVRGPVEHARLRHSGQLAGLGLAIQQRGHGEGVRALFALVASDERGLKLTNAQLVHGLVVSPVRVLLDDLDGGEEACVVALVGDATEQIAVQESAAAHKIRSRVLNRAVACK